MQPYLFPYVGYFQLIRSVDAFVVYDDVNYMKGGWINRNFILAQGSKQLITLPLDGASPNKRINQVYVGGRRRKLIEAIRQAYGKAPHFAEVYPLIKDVLEQQQENLAQFLEYQLRTLCNYLDIYPKWYVSSDLKKDNQLRGEDKVLAICQILGATHYINAPGGKALYAAEEFHKRGIALSFLVPRIISYRQFDGEFVPSLSIVDLMMFNNKGQCAALLEAYDLA